MSLGVLETIEGGSHKINRIHVVRNPGTGNWLTRQPKNPVPTGSFQTQREAIQDAREQLDRIGGEVVIHGRDGRIRDADTVPPGPDPCPPRDMKH